MISANVIAENILSQVNEEGHHQMIFDEILDYRKDHTALDETNGFRILPNGQKHPKMTTKGWTFLVQWKNG